MGKGTRKRDAKVKHMKMLRREQDKKLQNKRKIIKQIIISAISVCCITAIVFVGIGINSLVKNSGVFLRNKVAIQTENYKINNAMVSYFFNATYKSFSDYYGSSLSYYLDPDKSLREQNYSTSQTWFDYFMEAAQETIEGFLVLAEGATRDGISLNENEKAAIEIYLNNLDSENFGTGVKIDDVRSCLELMALANKYEKTKINDYTPTQDEIDKYVDENKQSLETFDYIYYTIEYSDNTFSEDEAKAYAEELASTKTIVDFQKWIKSFITDNPEKVEEPDSDKALENIFMNSQSYTKDNPFSEWAFAADTALLDTYIYDNTEDDEIIICMLTAVPALDTTNTKNVMHILVSSSTYGTDENALLNATDILSTWQLNNGTAEDFALLALSYSEDTGSSMKGGEYLNVMKGEMVSEFDEWCFNEARVSGDTEIIKTTFGYHIMYFLGNGNPVFESKVIDTITADKYEELTNELKEAYKITVDTDVMYRIYD